MVPGSNRCVYSSMGNKSKFKCHLQDIVFYYTYMGIFVTPSLSLHIHLWDDFPPCKLDFCTCAGGHTFPGDQDGGGDRPITTTDTMLNLGD